jgi:hypothetical protein
MVKAGDIVWANWPFTDQNASKRRPILMLSNIDSEGDFKGVPITTSSTVEYSLQITSDDLVGKLGLEDLKLITNSTLKYMKCSTLHSSILDVNTKLASVKPNFLANIKSKICESIK